MYRVPLWFVVINFDVTHLNVLLREIINVFLNKSSNYEKIKSYDDSRIHCSVKKKIP